MAWRVALQICDEELSRRDAAAQLDLDLAPAAKEPEPPEAPRPDARPEPTATKSGRLRWTRETIVEALASWLLSRASTEASFVTRHGPRGLVAASKRIFGRFDAALNHANLLLSARYPDGPPTAHRPGGAPRI
ncbi:MAG TPA: hypothetical protein VGM88_32150 [Kofleriaceae bacterium]